MGKREARRRVFITVAEVSGDRHAAQLVRALRELDPGLLIEGHGGPEMAAAGAVIHRETVSRAAMGWRGALRAVEISRVLRWTDDYFGRNKPDLQIGVDSPSMNFHFARLARRHHVPVMQYVAPQLWAWREGRMKKLRRYVDELACILPFEEQYFRRHGVNATFVGHPLFDELPPRRPPDPAERHPHRPPVVGLLPGSRTSEAAGNFGRLARVALLVRRAFAEARFLVPTTPATDALVRRRAAECGLVGAVEIGLGAFDEMVPRCDLCLTVSGTATLHVAGFGVPMLVVYHGSPLVWNALGRWLIDTRTFALVNVLAAGPRADPSRHIVPEFVPWYGPVEPVADVAIDYLRHPDKLREQRGRLRELVEPLDRPGASVNAAKLALSMLERGEATAPSPLYSGGKAGVRGLGEVGAD